MSEKLKVGQEFFVCNPFLGWSTSGGSVRVWLSLHYGHFKIKKVNEKSFLVDVVKEIGGGFGSKWGMDETYTKRFNSKQELIEIIRKAMPLRIQEMNALMIRFTQYAPEHHFGNAKIRFFEDFLRLANTGLQEEEIETFNKNWNEETNNLEKIITSLIKGVN